MMTLVDDQVVNWFVSIRLLPSFICSDGTPMPLDHYVSQVHLRNFYSPALGERMHGIRKRDLRKFPCRSEDVCRIEDGSTNKYLAEPRVIEEFLKTIEPKYNTSVEKLRAGSIDKEAVYVIAGFIAYVATCSPAAMRINAGPLRGVVETTANIIAESGGMPKAPDVISGDAISELLGDGSVVINIDEKYPQAIGITNVMQLLCNFGNFNWDILRNEEPGSPFFTSDYPVAIEITPDSRVLNRIVPLAPDLAVRIRPDVTREKIEEFGFPRFGFRRAIITSSEVREINRLIVQSAESLVFFRDDAPWVQSFVDRHKRFRIEPAVLKVPSGNGHLILTRLELREQTIT
jgi:Protein of unknown function (DUF4238)